MAQQSNMNDFFDQLPTPPREKAIRWGFYAGVSLLALGVGLKIMPPVNNLLDMMLHGAWTLGEIGLVGASIAVGTVAFTSLWPSYRRFMESVARRTTVAIYGDDPITPLHMWLAEVSSDCEQIEAAQSEVSGIIEENKKAASDNLTLLAQSDARFAFAVRKHGEESDQARNASAESGGYKDRAENADRINVPLIELYELLDEIAKANRHVEHEAKIAIETAEQEWRAALKAEIAMGAATRTLNKRSERYVNATLAFGIIRQKYAGNFGKLRSLRRLSEQAINSAALEGGVKLQESLARLRAESKSLLGHAPALAVPDFSGKGRQKVPVPAGSGPASLRLFDEEK
ncbi:MAG: hypothetical protein WDN10_04725 [bacterium]